MLRYEPDIPIKPRFWAVEMRNVSDVLDEVLISSFREVL